MSQVMFCALTPFSIAKAKISFEENTFFSTFTSCKSAKNLDFSASFCKSAQRTKDSAENQTCSLLSKRKLTHDEAESFWKSSSVNSVYTGSFSAFSCFGCADAASPFKWSFSKILNISKDTSRLVASCTSGAFFT